VTVLVDTTVLEIRARADAVRDAVRNTVAPSEISFAPPRRHLRYRMEHWQHGPATLVRAGGDPVHRRRTAAQVRDCAPEEATFGFQLRGRSRLGQNGRATEGTADVVTLIDMTRPFEFGMGEDCLHGSIGMSFDALALPVDLIRRSASGLPGSPVHDLFKAHLHGLIPAAQTLVGVHRTTVLAAATIELARALIATTAGDDLRRNGPYQEARRASIAAYVQQHLRDRDLTAERIAAANNVSVRQLYKLWSLDNAVGLAEWIVNGRLEGARRELAHPGSESVAITSMARRWGFVDAPHFSRRFRAAYGMSPREWRRLNHAGCAQFGADRARR
jgi:AraC-like DNA-binding protein